MLDTFKEFCNCLFFAIMNDGFELEEDKQYEDGHSNGKFAQRSKIISSVFA